MSDQQAPQPGQFNPQGAGAYGGAPMPPGAPVPPPKPWFKKWWVWVLIVVVLMGVGSMMAGGGDEEPAAAPAATTADPVESQKADEPTEQPSKEAEPQDGDGTRGNPHPIGTSISNNDWKVTVDEFTPDATKQVLKANEFNDKPKDGNVYALVRLTLTYVGADSDHATSVGVAYVTSSGNVINTFDNFVVAPDALGLDEMYTDATVTGNHVLEIPKGDDGLLRIRPGMFAKEVFFATS